MNWEDGHTDFPSGPKYWVQEKHELQANGDQIDKFRCIAVGSINEVQRKEEICTVTRTLEPLAAPLLSNAERGLGAELLNVPTAQNSTLDLLTAASTQKEDIPPVTPATASEIQQPADKSGVKLELNNGTDAVVVDESKSTTTPARPEAERFVTAEEGLKTLKIDDEKTNGNGASDVFAEKLQDGVVPALKKVDV